MNHRRQKNQKIGHFKKGLCPSYDNKCLIFTRQLLVQVCIIQTAKFVHDDQHYQVNQFILNKYDIVQYLKLSVRKDGSIFFRLLKQPVKSSNLWISHVCSSEESSAYATMHVHFCRYQINFLIPIPSLSSIQEGRGVENDLCHNVLDLSPFQQCNYCAQVSDVLSLTTLNLSRLLTMLHKSI